MTSTQDRMAAEDTGQAANVLARVTANPDGLDLKTIGTVLVRSGYFKDTEQVSQAIVKVLAGRELGFGPIASMQGVYIVKGRVTLAANLVAAAIQRSGRFRYRVTKLDKSGCTIKFFERWGSDQAWTEIGESSFDAEDATTAGLNKGENYRNFPRNMYFARALTNGARWYTPEVFNGPIYTPDEMGARVDDDGQIIDIPAAPPMDTAERDRLAAKYTETFGDDARGSAYDLERKPTRNPAGDLVDTATGEVLEERAAPSRTSLWDENRRLIARAAELGLTGAPTLPNRSTEDVIATANRELAERIQNFELDQREQEQQRQQEKAMF